MVEDDHGEGAQLASQWPGCAVLQACRQGEGMVSSCMGTAVTADQGPPTAGSSPDSIPNTSSHHDNLMAHILNKK